jgi:hypothetical protein
MSSLLEPAQLLSIFFFLGVQTNEKVLFGMFIYEYLYTGKMVGRSGFFRNKRVCVIFSKTFLFYLKIQISATSKYDVNP